MLIVWEGFAGHGGAPPVPLHEALNRVPPMIAHRHAQSTGEHHLAEVPNTHDLHQLREAAAQCAACPLYKNATQTVFGEGPTRAKVVLVGEQPGDQEDRAGRPFVGPAGQLLDKALEEAGLARNMVCITNAVKHFKWEPRGKRRLHAKPNSREILACKPWLFAELDAVRPEVLILLGATAAQSVLGPQTRVLRDRGQVQKSEHCAQTVITVHPSSLLRAPDEQTRARNYAQFVEDLRVAAAVVE